MMKRTIIALSLQLFFLLSFSQSDTISENLYQSQGRLGIGTNSPEYLIDILDDVDNSSSHPRQFINLHNTNNTGLSNVAIHLRSGTDGNESKGSLGTCSNTYDAIPNLAGFTYLYSGYQGLALRAVGQQGVIKFNTGGNGDDFERMRIDVSGNVGIGVLNPAAKLDINGAVKLGYSDIEHEGSIRWTGEDFEGFDGESWNSFTFNSFQHNNIYFSSDRLGIGTEAPNALLEIQDDGSNHPKQFIQIHNVDNSSLSNVAMHFKSGTEDNEARGSLGVSAMSYSANPDLAGFTYLYSDYQGIALRAVGQQGVIKFNTAGNGDSFERMRIDSAGNVGIGVMHPAAKLDINGAVRLGFSEDELEGSIRWTGQDFEGFNGESWNSFTHPGSFDHDNVYFFNERLGIGINEPAYLLDISADSDGRGSQAKQFIHLQNLNNSTLSNVAVNLESGTDQNMAAGSFGVCANSYSANPDLAGFTYIYSDYQGLALRAVGQQGIIKFNTAGNGDEYERMRIDESGNIGLGTSSPSAKLHIAGGDVYISDIEHGIIMKSPDGNCWRGVLDNSGQLVFSLIECPDAEVINNSPEVKSTNQFSIFPNPGKAFITVKTSEDLNNLKYRIFDANGKVLIRGRLKQQEQIIGISALPSGTYFVSVIGNNRIPETKPFIKE